MAWYGRKYVEPVVLASNDFEQPDREAPFFAGCPTLSDPQYQVTGQPTRQWEDMALDGLSLVTDDVSFWMVLHNGHIVAEGQARACLAFMAEYVRKLEEANDSDFGEAANADTDVVWNVDI